MTQFQLRALESVRGVEVAGLISPRRRNGSRSSFASGLGEGAVFESVREMARNVDVVAIFNPNFRACT